MIKLHVCSGRSACRSSADRSTSCEKECGRGISLYLEGRSSLGIQVFPELSATRLQAAWTVNGSSSGESSDQEPDWSEPSDAHEWSASSFRHPLRPNDMPDRVVEFSGHVLLL